MPNIKSAKKRTKIIEKKTLENNMIKSEVRTAIKAFEQAVEAKDAKKAQELYVQTVSKIDKCESKGIIKANTSARKKSSLAKKLNSLDK